MNLSPDWVAWFEQRGWSAIHWSTTGDPRAPDRVILGWARAHGQILFTHDLDFGAILASAGAVSPSVVQLRTNDVTPQASGTLVLEVLVSFETELEKGALVTVDEEGSLVRLLPLRMP